MYIHLVELEAMQTVSSLQNGYTGFHTQTVMLMFTEETEEMSGALF